MIKRWTRSRSLDEVQLVYRFNCRRTGLLRYEVATAVPGEESLTRKGSFRVSCRNLPARPPRRQAEGGGGDGGSSGGGGGSGPQSCKYGGLVLRVMGRMSCPAARSVYATFALTGTAPSNWFCNWKRTGGGYCQKGRGTFVLIEW